MIELLNIDCMAYMAGLPDKALSPKEKKAKRMKAWYEKTKDKRLAMAKEYRSKNRESFNEYRNNWRTKTPSGIYDVIKQGAKKRGVDFLLNRLEFINWHNNQAKECFYCKRSEEEISKDEQIIRTKITRLTIDRMINSIGYVIENITLSCMRCNSIKSNFFSVEEMLKIGKIINDKLKCQK